MNISTKTMALGLIMSALIGTPGFAGDCDVLEAIGAMTRFRCQRQLGNGSDWRHANGQYAGSAKGGWYYANGQFAGTEGGDWYHPNGQFAGSAKAGDWYYSNGKYAGPSKGGEWYSSSGAYLGRMSPFTELEALQVVLKRKLD